MAKFSVEIQQIQAEKEREPGAVPSRDNDVGIDPEDSAAAQNNRGNGQKVNVSA